MSNLNHFTHLTPSILIHEPETTISLQNPNPASTSPDLILICAWLNAPLKHIFKYTSAHKSQHPTSRILIITTSTINTLTSSSSSSNLARLLPALDILYKLPGDAKILVHSFSNGGAFTITSLAREYASTKGIPIPITAMTLDSSPGKFHYHATILAFSIGLPKNPLVQFMGIFILRILLGIYKVHYALWGKLDAIEKARRDLNDERLFAKDARRCYVYSEGDRMVRWRDVEEHAGEAVERGYRVLRERFVEGGHVGLMVGDGGRYLQVLRGVWEGGW
ncbi:indole-diterpene biosynthesis protein PaxU [Sclerotinia borealis F-4128]|uniref:Indole-diterpene biosynthesis protein PaxU n=1 Tax=Sclerotinia borealis (strain F-4128) TaxID=1432307 RepID=W9CKR5_SCLBF|nr:indole-diterpene biosynthesis protein PaxU [Sclerotinia borealis F-4128]